MDYIQTANKQVDKFGAGQHGFSAGVPGVSLATALSAAWHDDVQQEIINIILAAGIVPAANTRNQLLLALRAAGVFTTPATGDRSTKAATAAMFTNEFASSIGASGYQKLPTGLILQWGTLSTPGINTNTAVSFPIAFPTACRHVGLSGIVGTVANSSSDGGAAASTYTTTQFTLVNSWDGGVAPANVSWLALGH